MTDNRMGGAEIGIEMWAEGGGMNLDRINRIFRINEWGAGWDWGEPQMDTDRIGFGEGAVC